MFAFALFKLQESTMERSRVGLKRVRQRLSAATKQAKRTPWMILVLFVFGICFGVYFLSRLYRLGRLFVG
jgi:hypothetical protein